MAVLEVRGGNGRGRREDPLVEHVVDDPVAHCHTLGLLAVPAAQPEQREVHLPRERVVLGTHGDQPMRPRHVSSVAWSACPICLFTRAACSPPPTATRFSTTRGFTSRTVRSRR